MTEQYGFDFDIERCVQCHACEVACKSSHSIELGIKWRNVVAIWKGEYPNIVNRTLSMACQHCGEAPCEAICPTGAITQRSEDGIVLVNQDECIGCRCCFTACPFNIPSFGSDGKMQKCDLCIDRLEAGKEPACVATCPAEALRSGPMEELSLEGTKRFAQKLALEGHTPECSLSRKKKTV
ncbi:MAG: 4Fe-4S dicluster domain-containing protein [Deltaproteobacteria bacterium]|nr:4Fe-4S dicluster domain-containing protein [Deltaproteobacteria bacterium]